MTRSSLSTHAAWQVGDDPSRPPSGLGADEQRSARLAARLDVYARYADLLAGEAAAVMRGDVARGAALAAERDALAEHYAEVRAVPTTGEFDALLGDALVEIDHQASVDLALRRELAQLAEGLRALPGPGAQDDAIATSAPHDLNPGVDPVFSVFASALIGARASGAGAGGGGVLAGQFPGAAGEGGMPYGGEVDAGAPTAERARLDLRF